MWIERAAWIVLTGSLLVYRWAQTREEMRLRDRLRKVLEASRMIAVAANRDVSEYDSSPVTKEHRQNGFDTSIMVVARLSLWRDFIAAVKGD